VSGIDVDSDEELIARARERMPDLHDSLFGLVLYEASCRRGRIRSIWASKGQATGEVFLFVEGPSLAAMELEVALRDQLPSCWLVTVWNEAGVGAWPPGRA
jgi:hypothetical protein